MDFLWNLFLGVNPKIGGKPPKWMVYSGKSNFLMDDLGGKPPIFGRPPKSRNSNFLGHGCVFVLKNNIFHPKKSSSSFLIIFRSGDSYGIEVNFSAIRCVCFMLKSETGKNSHENFPLEAAWMAHTFAARLRSCWQMMVVGGFSEGI